MEDRLRDRKAIPDAGLGQYAPRRSRVHVGLGENAASDIEIRWPSGQHDRHEAVEANAFYLAVEGRPLEIDPLARPLKQPQRP